MRRLRSVNGISMNRRISTSEQVDIENEQIINFREGVERTVARYKTIANSVQSEN